MRRRTFLTVGTVLTLLALLPIVGWPLYRQLTLKKASPALVERTTRAVEKHPELRPDYDRAMEDGVLSYDEAKEILGKAGEAVGPDG
jgi:hypothetical protein